MDTTDSVIKKLRALIAMQDNQLELLRLSNKLLTERLAKHDHEQTLAEVLVREQYGLFEDYTNEWTGGKQAEASSHDDGAGDT